MALPFANAPMATVNLSNYTFYIDSITGPSQVLPTAISTSDNGMLTVNLGATAAGVHQLYVTVKNAAGHISLVSVLTFYKEGNGIAFANAPAAAVNLSNYKFYIDSLNGPLQNLPTANALTDNSTQTVNLGATASGVHQLYVTAQDILGNTSLVNQISFYKDGVGSAFANAPQAATNLTNYEFYIDSLTGPVQSIAAANA